MGYSSDLGMSTVKDVDPVTGYPRDEDGQLLRTVSYNDGTVTKDWDKPGTTLYNFTSPYGHLGFATGSGGDFYCYDYKMIDAGPRGQFIILHAVINSESGGVIETAGYEVVPINTSDERREAAKTADSMMDYFENACHDRRWWNQDEKYFFRAVVHALFMNMFQRHNPKTGNYECWTTAKMLRFGGKRIDKTISAIVWPIPSKVTVPKGVLARRTKKGRR
jgi:hypothetical protein